MPAMLSTYLQLQLLNSWYLTALQKLSPVLTSARPLKLTIPNFPFARLPFWRQTEAGNSTATTSGSAVIEAFVYIPVVTAGMSLIAYSSNGHLAMEF